MIQISKERAEEDIFGDFEYSDLQPAVCCVPTLSIDYNAPAKKTGKMHNVLPLWGNEATMNLNPLILANIQSSSYFKGISR